MTCTATSAILCSVILEIEYCRVLGAPQLDLEMKGERVKPRESSREESNLFRRNRHKSSFTATKHKIQ